ncbi:17987_t:CDS:2 [Dentiscutata erythropus]|uniref:17987_t:CDS:1 n=1 Tax=Dentiscutata erythropus TaxID=1348616 RepID=A0A9N9BYE2_9GLOM|nr:17987_t:CDS:2 [Dentiscutata erythropus]
MDFITDLPISLGFDFILVVVNQLSKMAHFIACRKSISTEQTAQLIFRERVMKPPSPVIMKDKSEYEVDAILDLKIFQKKLYYLFAWKGYDINEHS